MGVVGTAEYLFQATGVNRVLAGLRKFSAGVTRTMKTAGKATEKTDKITRKSILGYAALGAAIGTVFTDFLRSSSVISTLMATVSTLFGALADTILVELLPVFLPLINAFVDVIKWVQELPGPFKAAIGVAILLGLALVTLGGPLTAIAIAVAAAIFIWQNWGDIVEWFQTHVLEPFGVFVDSFVQGLKDAWGGLLTFFGNLWASIGASFQGAIDTILGPFKAASEGLVGFFSGLWDTIGTIFQAVIDNVITPFVALFTGPVQTVKDVWNTLVGFFTTLKTSVKTVLDLLLVPFESFVGGIETAFGGVVSFFTTLFGTLIPNAMRGGINAVIGFFEGFANALITAFNALGRAMVDTVNAILLGYRVLSFIPAFIVVPVPADITHTPIPPITPLPRLAAGGIFGRPTVALIGEAGPEAVLPLRGPIPANILAPVLRAALAQAPTGLVTAQRGMVVGAGGRRAAVRGGSPIIIHITNIFEIGAGGIPALPDLGDEEVFRRRYREAGEEVGEGILTVLHRRRE